VSRQGRGFDRGRFIDLRKIGKKGVSLEKERRGKDETVEGGVGR